MLFKTREVIQTKKENQAFLQLLNIVISGQESIYLDIENQLHSSPYEESSRRGVHTLAKMEFSPTEKGSKLHIIYQPTTVTMLLIYGISIQFLIAFAIYFFFQVSESIRIISVTALIVIPISILMLYADFQGRVSTLSKLLNRCAQSD